MGARELLEDRYPGRSGIPTAAKDLHARLEARGLATHLKIESLQTKLGELKRRDATWWISPKRADVVAALAELLGSTPEQLLGPQAAHAGGIHFTEFPSLPSLSPHEDPCLLAGDHWLLDEVLDHLERAEGAPRWMQVPAGWGKSLIVQILKDRFADDADASSVKSLVEVGEMPLTGPTVVELELASAGDRRLWRALKNRVTAGLVVMAPFPCPSPDDGLVLEFTDQIWAPPLGWQKRLLDWVSGRIARSATHLDASKMAHWLRTNPIGRFVEGPGDLLALCADFHHRAGGRSASAHARANWWLRSVAPGCLPDDAPRTWRETRIPELSRAAARERLRQTQRALDDAPDPDGWDALVPAREKPPRDSANGEAMVVEYLRQGGLLRGSAGGLELFPNWIRVAQQVAELEDLRDDVESWGLIAADVSRQPIVDTWLDGLTAENLQGLVSTVLREPSTAPTFGSISALESVFAAIGRRGETCNKVLKRFDVQRVVERQFELVRQEHKSTPRVVPVTRPDHAEFLANAWTISLAWQCDSDFDPGNFARYVPGWSDAVSLAELGKHFLPYTSLPPETTESGARRLAALGRQFISGEAEPPSGPIPRLLVPGYIIVATERGWPITAEHVGRLAGTWEEWQLSRWISRMDPEMRGSVLRSLWSITPELIGDSPSLIGGIQHWTEQFKFLGAKVVASVTPSAAAAMVRAHGLFADPDGDGDGADLLAGLDGRSRDAALEAWIDQTTQPGYFGAGEQARTVAELLEAEDLELVVRLVAAIPDGHAADALVQAAWRLSPTLASARAVHAVLNRQPDAGVWSVHAPRGHVLALLFAMEKFVDWPAWGSRCLTEWLSHGGEIGAKAHRLLDQSNDREARPPH